MINEIFVIKIRLMPPVKLLKRALIRALYKKNIKQRVPSSELHKFKTWTEKSSLFIKEDSIYREVR